MNSSLEKLIKGCIKNKRKSQEALYRMYFPKMMAMCYKYTSDEDKAISIVNDGFLKVFKNIASYSGKGSFDAWVRRLVFNTISDFYRKENRYLKMMIFEEHEKPTNLLPLDHLYYDDLLKLVAKLPGNTHKVFHYYAIEGFSHKEIAQMLGISEGTSKWHLSEARKRLRSLLENTNLKMNHAG